MAGMRVAGVLAMLILGWTGPAGAQGTAWLHATVETRGTSGEQVSTFRAFTTSDEAGTQRITVDRICVKGIAHRVEERCAANSDAVELVERTTGLPGVGNLCVEAVASAESKVGPLSATARACP
ncbi:MAG TPA: hypothetical protein VIE44_06625 [Methylomirabilota bacterium]|jgi:hypothetical protein